MVIPFAYLKYEHTLLDDKKIYTLFLVKVKEHFVLASDSFLEPQLYIFRVTCNTVNMKSSTQDTDGQIQRT